jgi:ring-1,2-phenylacetyl-CoA epoxidase subunit PaaC
MTTLDLSRGAFEYLLAFADDEHLIGARHTSWIGVAPFLEEDLAFCSIAQDELGHAISLYELLTDDVDRFALCRESDAYRSCWLVELPCRDWADALVRHVLYDLGETIRWDALGLLPELQALAGRAQREEAFHIAHASSMLGRMLDAGGLAAEQVVASTDQLLPIAVALWEPVAGEASALAEGVAVRSSAASADLWWTAVSALYSSHGVTLQRPAAVTGQHGRRARSIYFADLQAEITKVIDLDRRAVW